MKQILDAKYEAADLKEIARSCTTLQYNEQYMLYKVLTNYKSLFDGSLGHWVGETYHIELKPESKPYHARA